MSTAAPGVTGAGPLPGYERPQRQFHWADYLVFALTLGIAAVVGLYYGISRRKTMTVKELLVGGRNLRVIPVSISLLATLVSTLFVLGVPSETYYAAEWPLELIFAFVPATIVTAHIFVPIYHRLEVTSAYEYLGLRFNNKIRFMSAIIFLILSLVTQALSVYTPAVAFALVANVSLEVSVLAAGLVCTFYTALGGLRAVVAIDIIQVVIILSGVVGLLIKGAVDVGGIGAVFSLSGENNRLQIWNYNLATTSAYGTWPQLIGGSFLFMNVFATNQTSVQRYCSIAKCKSAQKAVYLSMVMYILAWILVLLLGLIIYTFYYLCDPLLREIIYSPDQIVPLFVMDSIGDLHGLPGLFTGSIFGAVLSTVSSGINSLAAVTLEDMVKPVHAARTGRDLTEGVSRSLTRVLALVFGIMTIGLAYLPISFGTFLLNIDVIFSVFGVLGGPMLGLFLMGTLFPIANSLGAGVGLVLGLVFGLWMWIGRILCSTTGSSMSPPEIPSVCLDNYNITSYTGEGAPILWPTKSLFTDCPGQPLYDLSYLWYGLIGTGVTMVTGTIVSFCTCGHRGNVVDPALLCFGNKCYKNSLKFMHPAVSKISPKNRVKTKYHQTGFNSGYTEEVYHISNLTASGENPEVPKHRQDSTGNMQILW